MKENKHQTKQDFIKPINNSMQMDLKSKQIFRVWSNGRVWVETEGEYKQKKRNEIMNLLRKINRHIKLIEKKIKREHSENKASFPEFCVMARCLGPTTKGIPSESHH